MHWNDLRMTKCEFACADLCGYENFEAKEAPKKGLWIEELGGE